MLDRKEATAGNPMLAMTEPMELGQYQEDDRDNSIPDSKQTAVTPIDPIDPVLLDACFSDTVLAKELIEWGLSDSSMPACIGNRNGFRNLVDCSASINLVVALLVVHQYAYGEIGSLPKQQDGKARNLDKHSKEAHSRCMEMVKYITETAVVELEGTPLSFTAEKLLDESLYHKIDGLKKRIKFGIYDPEAENCYCDVNCKGVYWKHYRKLNQVFEGLFDPNIEVYLKDEDKRIFLDNTDRKYKTYAELQELGAQEYIRQTKCLTPPQTDS